MSEELINKEMWNVRRIPWNIYFIIGPSLQEYLPKLEFRSSCWRWDINTLGHLYKVESPFQGDFMSNSITFPLSTDSSENHF